MDTLDGARTARYGRRALDYLAEHGPSLTSTLARAIGTRLPYRMVWDTLRALERDGLIRREHVPTTMRGGRPGTLWSSTG